MAKHRKKAGSSSATRVRRRRAVPDEPAARLTVPLVLGKFVELALMAAFLGAVLAYHLSLPESWLVRLSDWMMRLNDGAPVVPGANPFALLIQDFAPFLSQGLPVLELKTTVWLLAALPLFAAHLLARLYEAFFRVPVLPPVATPSRRDWGRLVPLLCIVGYLVLALVSFSGLGWAPKPPVDAVPIAPEAEALEGARAGLFAWLHRMAMPQGAGTYHAWTAWVQVLGGLLFFVVAEDAIRTRRLVYKLLGLILGLGVVAAAVAVLVHAGLPGLSAIWVKWGPDNYRNDVAGFIGHNTALSSFMIAPLLIAWTLLMTHGDRMAKWVKALVWGAMAVMAVALIMAQSRAVIPILLVAFGALVALLARRAGLRPPLAIWVAIPLVLAVLLLSQFIKHPANPLYRKNLPLAVRIQHMAPEHLLTETRLRIPVCSWPVIRSHPLLGTGFGSFHFVYPQAQGEYYAANPESRIMPTPRKSFHAHNEYLQTLFETGLLGLALALAGVTAILLSGWKTVRRTFRQRHIALQMAILTSLVAMLVHCLLDFPLRVAPLSATLVLLLAMWSAGDRLWLIPVAKLDERASGTGEPPPPPARRKGPATNGSKLQTALAGAWLALVPLLAAAVVAISAMACEWFAANTLSLRAQSAMDAYLDLQAQGQSPDPQYIMQGHQNLKDARRLIPLHGEPYYYGARVLYIAASNLDRERSAALRAGDNSFAEDMRRRGLIAAGEALELLNRSLNEFRFHGSYYQRALIHYQTYRFSEGIERDAALHAAMADLEFAVLMNPGDPDMVRTLIEWKERFGARSEAEVDHLYRLLYHFHPLYFNETILKDALKQRALLDYRRSYERFRLMMRIDPANLTFREHAATTAALHGDLPTARLLAEKLLEIENPTGPAVQALIALREQRFDLATTALDHPLLALEGRPREYRNMLRRLLAAAEADRRQDPEAARREYDALLEQGTRQPESLIDAGIHLEAILGRPDVAAEFARARLAIADPPPWNAAWVLLAESLLAPHRADMGKLAARQDAARRANEPLPIADTPALREALLEALRLYDFVAQRTTDRQESLVVRNRANELATLLGPEAPPP
ncbi:MAG: O-antigen ligase family protein [Candidatus Sumerlaeia bacterium]|nr:O-antigen ligase family protein [Candidatus Sumerlaeia bacterium]